MSRTVMTRDCNTGPTQWTRNGGTREWLRTPRNTAKAFSLNRHQPSRRGGASYSPLILKSKRERGY